MKTNRYTFAIAALLTCFLAGCSQEIISNQAATQTGDAENTPASEKYARCLLLLSQNNASFVSKEIINSEDYNKCVGMENVKPISSAEFRDIITKKYNMAALEANRSDFSCFPSSDDMVCSSSFKMEDGSVSITYSSQGLIKKVTYEWLGHSTGISLQKLFGKPSSTFDRETGFQYFYQFPSGYYCIISVGGAKTRLSYAFEV